MNSLRFMALLSLVLVAVDASAAKFKITNAGSNRIWVKPFWGAGDPYLFELKPGQSKDLDSGVSSVSLMRWVQEFPVALGQTQGQLNVKSFDAGNGIKMNPVELGVTIDILNDGSYKVQKILQPAQTATAQTINGF
jgi:hypothetical protein